MRLRGLTVAALGIAILWSLGAAPAQSAQPAVTVNAEGNAFTGGLRFNPAAVSVKVGDVVRWTNTDPVVPHTATEDHSLWNLTGTYGQTPATPPGFGPGEMRERAFAAGSWSYFCEVHPTQMRGTVDVPVSLSQQKGKRKKKRKKGASAEAKRRKRFRITAVWASEALPQGQVFDVQARRGSGDWKTVEDATRGLQGTFAGGPKGTTWSFRARVRAETDPTRASGYSPGASITVG